MFSYKWNDYWGPGTPGVPRIVRNQMDPYGPVTLRVYKRNQMDPNESIWFHLFGSICMLSRVKGRPGKVKGLRNTIASLRRWLQMDSFHPFSSILTPPE